MKRSLRDALMIGIATAASGFAAKQFFDPSGSELWLYMGVHVLLTVVVCLALGKWYGLLKGDDHAR
jgi:hypothetical protein